MPLRIYQKLYKEINLEIRTFFFKYKMRHFRKDSLKDSLNFKAFLKHFKTSQHLKDIEWIH